MLKWSIKQEFKKSLKHDYNFYLNICILHIITYLQKGKTHNPFLSFPLLEFWKTRKGNSAKWAGKKEKEREKTIENPSFFNFTESY